MGNRDEPVTAKTNRDQFASKVGDGAVEASALDCTRSRIEQLAHLRDKLAAGQPITKRDLTYAYRRAKEAQIRARRAHLSAAAQHGRSAQAHERAARAHDESVAQGIGDVEAHRRAAAAHRTARDDDYRAANNDLRLAEVEIDPTRGP